MADQRVPMTFRDLFADDPFFKSTWDDFERAREKMMKESREMWKKFEGEDGDFTRETLRPRTSRSSEKGSKSNRTESSSRTYESRSSSNMGSSSSKQQERSSSGRSSRNNNEGSSRTRQEDMSDSGRTSRNNNEGSSRTRQEDMSDSGRTSRNNNEGSSTTRREEMSNSGRSSRNENDGLSRKYDERSSRRSEKGSSNEISGGHDWMIPPSWMFPKPEGLRMDMNDADNEVITVKENDDKFEVSLNTSKYKPSELQVNVGGGIISVEGKHEEKAEDGTVMVSRQFSRQYSLPERAKPTNVVSNLSSDGILVVTAPKDKPAITQGQRSVPIAV